MTRILPQAMRPILLTTMQALVVAIVLITVTGSASGQQQEKAKPRDAQAAVPQLTTDQIVDRLVRCNLERAEALRSFQATRRYSLDYRGFPTDKAGTMVVDALYSAPASKQFHIVTEDGSRLILDHVLHKLLEAETEAATPENRDHVALTRDNYDFSLLGMETLASGPAYILQVEPKSRNKFLYRGQIWVDARDFAVARIVAQPAKNPSFWIKQSDIEHRYQKVGQFWLPLRNHTITQVRLGGRSELTIAYDDYRITDALPVVHDAMQTTAATVPVSAR